MHCHPTTDEPEMQTVLEQAKRAGIAKIIFSHLGLPLIPHNPTRAQIREYNDYGTRLRDHHAGWMDMYVYINPRHGEVAVKDVEKGVQQQGAIGVKMEWCREPNGSLDTTVAVVRRAGELGVPCLIHTFFRKGGNQEAEVSPVDIVYLAKACPHTNIIMAHFGGDWIRAARTVKDFPNIYGDTSGCTWRGGFTEFVVREVGARRVLYGSDIPIRAFGPQFAKVLRAGLTEEELRLVFYENAQRLFYAKGS